MTTQLSIYNRALYIIGERKAATTADATEPVRLLGEVWTSATKYCLEQGHWKFAMAEAKLTASLTELPTFGLTKAFAKPTDFVRLNALCTDEFFGSPLTQYNDRGLFWYAMVDPIYIRYVSNDPTIGMDMTRWPESFVLYVASYLASITARRISPDIDQQKIDFALRDAKTNALAKDAVEGPTQFLPTGKWVQARRGGTPNGRSSNTSFYGS